jgi:pimeloyl-ACP methyl ester carboxylesterase
MMRVIADTPPTGERPLLVMLPGADMSAEDFRGNGFFEAVRRAGLAVDVIAVETGMECYLDGVTVAELHAILPPGPLWLVGISLGGMGALLYARAHPERVMGVTVLAPFIGTRGLIAEVERAGGLRHWRGAPDEPPTDERRLLAWLGAGVLPDIRLAYGTEDRFVAAHRLLADILPADRVLTAAGGHDWPTWRRLWQDILSTTAFGAAT